MQDVTAFAEPVTFQTPSAGRWVLQPDSAVPRHLVRGRFKPHQRGGGCCSNIFIVSAMVLDAKFQTPSAGRWVLQRVEEQGRERCLVQVSNPISGEVGAAAPFMTATSSSGEPSFKPHQRGGGCCSISVINLCWCGLVVSNPISGEVGAAAFGCNRLALARRNTFQTPSAGRWVLQRAIAKKIWADAREVSNPISGEVGAAALLLADPTYQGYLFQTPSAGRWVLQRWHYKDQQEYWRVFQTPSAGRWVLQLRQAVRLDQRQAERFKPHQRGGGCCSCPLRLERDPRRR